jgi:flagellar FliL protein
LSAPESETASDAVDGDAPPPAKKPRFSKKMLIIVGAVLLLLVVGGGAAYFLMGSGEKSTDHGEEVAEESSSEEGESYIDAPAMVINMRSADGGARFLKLRFTLVPANAAAGEKIKTKLPLIIDSFQPFLRELRPEDLAGSAAVFRIKEEMLVRATGAMGPHIVKDVLIQDLIQQ